MEKLFILGDGNQIRVKIERLLFQYKFQDVKTLSQNITKAIDTLKIIVKTEFEGNIIMAGGDDLLFTIEEKEYREEILHKMAKVFIELTDCSFSFGVGKTIEIAHSNLNKAKVYNKVVEK